MGTWTGTRIEADTILPVQYYGRSALLTPQLKLRAAVLEEAFQSLNRKVTYNALSARERMQHAVYEDAARWFRSADRHWPYSFVNICEALGLDPDAVRQRIGKVRGPFHLDFTGVGQQRPVLVKGKRNAA